MIQASSMLGSVYIDAPGALHHILEVSGYDFGKVVNRVAWLFDMKPREILLPSKRSVQKPAACFAIGP